MNDTAIIDGADKPFPLKGDQGSIEWLYERCGKITASRFVDVTAKLKNGGPKAERDKYMWELIVERLTGEPSQHFESAAMQWGKGNEPAARMAYEARTGNIVTSTGFLLHPKMAFVGASPDGVIDDDGGIEIKCPFNSAVHLQTILNGIPEAHLPQMYGGMIVTGRKWWDFVSYDPRMPEELSIYIKRVEYNSDYANALIVELKRFNDDIESTIRKLRGEE